MATTIERKPVHIEKKPKISQPFFIGHIVGLVIVGAVLLFLLVLNLRGAFLSPGPDLGKNPPPKPPDYQFWHNVPTQHIGRYKPFETACKDAMRDIHGRERLFRQSATAVFLMWLFENDWDEAQPKSKWDDVPFILCQHQDLRRLIYRLQDNGDLKPESELTVAEIHGKYISPNELKQFKTRLEHLQAIDFARFRTLASPLESQLNETLGRLTLYQKIRRQYMPQEKIGRYIHFVAFVALDKVKGTPWFSIDELRLIDRHPEAWFEILRERVKKTPELYLSPEHHKALGEFQEQVKTGTADEAIKEVKESLKKHRDAQVKKYHELREMKRNDEALEIVIHTIRTWPMGEKRSRAQERFSKLLNKKEPDIKGDTELLRNMLSERDEELLADLKDQIPAPSEYYPSHPKWQQLHMSYLELRFPNLYKEVTSWQQPPTEDIKQVLAKYEAAGKAYRSGDAAKFEEASKDFFQTLKEVSEKVAPYPGEDTILSRATRVVTGDQVGPPSEQLLNLELTFNKVRPFMWGWILMLIGLTLFAVSLGLNSRICYIGGFVFFGLSLAFQAFGFFTRIIVSGRPPVTNMYETVIWVAFMSSIFALILELVFRRKVIAVAGALVATVGLVLADQMPLALNPQINPLVPVLRSNFWLTIHVLTIVSSYAAGTLAWGLGNISLMLIVFGSTRRDTIKMLSNFTYRALQIAVLLLAAGTFLGGWWAAYSWGRFWGWDPKENGALIALLCYVIPLHMRFIGWVKDFGLAVSAILCYGAILLAWYGINFIWPAGLHAYGFSNGSEQGWVFLAISCNIEWVLAASLIYKYKLTRQVSV